MVQVLYNHCSSVGGAVAYSFFECKIDEMRLMNSLVLPLTVDLQLY